MRGNKAFNYGLKKNRELSNIERVKGIMLSTKYNWMPILMLLSMAGGGTAGEVKPPARFQADFHMTRTLKQLKDAVRSEGRLYMGGGGLLRWETTSPARSVLIVNRGKGWLHYPELEVTKGFDVSTDPVMKVLSEHLLALTGGDFESVSSMYDIRSVDAETRELVPKGGEIKKLFSLLRVTTGGKGMVSRVELISQRGDTTSITFFNVVENPKWPAEMFERPANR